MPLTLVAGPPGSGKTHRLLDEARAAARRGERVWWIGLPAQRSHVLRALVRDGPILGVEVLSPQQAAYRVLSDLRRLRPLLTGTGRLATVGEALMDETGEPPAPGEARLFAHAIAEAKRHGVPPGRIPGDDPETARLRRVFRAYEARKGDAWDYDDIRTAAAEALEAGGVAEARGLLPDRAFVDGYREVGPADLRLYDALAAAVPVVLAVALDPPGREVDARLPARDDVEVRAHRFPNPVAEARWVLRDVKAALAGGADPLDLALVVPPGRARAIAALADEFGVPLMDETPRGLADRREGRRLLDLLELGDAPTASRLLAVPDLHGLGVAALDAGVAGGEAIARLAEARGETAAWRAWRERLEPSGDLLDWGATLVDEAVAAVHGDAPPDGDEATRELVRFRELALQRLAEARRVADGPRVRAWWAALLQETFVFERPAAGVALLHAVQASGRRFRRAWIVGATENAHVGREREDYFVPEDARAPWPATFRTPGLPHRFLARAGAEVAELRARGDVTIVTVPGGDVGGPSTPDRDLVGDAPTEPPDLPAGSVLELGGAEPYRPPDGPVDLGPPDVARLGRYADCGLRFWAEARVLQDDAPPDWIRLRARLRSRPRWSESELRGDLLGPGDDGAGDGTGVGSGAGGGPGGVEASPTWPAFAEAAAAWLDRHAAELATFTFGVRLRGGAAPEGAAEAEAPPDGGSEGGVGAYLDGARRADGVALILRFAAPGTVHGPADAERVLDARAADYWAADHLLRRHGRQVRSVRFRVWPVLGAPVDFPERPISRSWGRFARVRRDVDAALPEWRAGRVRPSPGFVCRDCPVFDLCREGRR